MMERPVLEIPVSSGSIIEEVLFLGTGTSSCTPLIGCLMADPPTCRVCLDAARLGPSKNRRFNVSALVRYRPSKGGRLRNVLIDCGKSFYAAAKEWLVRDRVWPLDGVILTHGHADAILGLDDLRHFTGHGSPAGSLQIWADASTMAVVKSTFPYLVNASEATGGGFVSDLAFNLIEEPLRPFSVGELTVAPIRVEHGISSDGSVFGCLGFILDTDRLVYISDASRVPEDVMAKIQGKDLLVLDCLREHRPYRSHMILAQSLEVVKAARPRNTFLVGMAHDAEHAEFQARIDKLVPGQGVRLAYDGLVLRFKQPTVATE